jgi:predicted DCC family thiol-disulfide oxidoreductase YuxK
MPTVFFDGDCALCNGAVRFARRNGADATVRFLPLASPEAVAFAGSETIVFADAHGTFERSDAVLRLAGHLRPPWPQLALAARAVPRPLRDRIYRAIAANRHKLRHTG